MDYGCCCSLVMVVVAFLCGFRVGFSMTIEVHLKNFISWDDIKVDEHQIKLSDSRVNRNRSRVIVVNKNGGADSVTVQGAIDMVPENNTRRVKIFILPGTYREKVTVPKSKPYISFELRSASVTVLSDYFCATDITFENTVIQTPGEPGMQAVALRISGDKAMFYKVKVVGTQDTLLDETGSHYFYQSHIRGSVDFIFDSLKQDCVIESTAVRTGAIAAHRRDSPNDNTGFSFANCKINGTGRIYLEELGEIIQESSILIVTLTIS
ncbi:Pectinesterase QRT1 [Hibiscus syriacus]|uniref:pectinesterase n=1 Tax=Hibiscus syriacus TaxID=106335 RepID=A0A6A2XBY1_HIBSY|nr:Pectinesterase QRT1 [Hibiscus syriacus]